MQVRFYGHYSGPFDAAVLEHLPDIRALLVDCLQDIANPEWLERLDHLEYLSLGVFKWNDPSILSKLKIAKLRWLLLSDNAKRNIDLGPLEQCRDLETLSLVGHTRNIEVITTLPRLTDLFLSGMPKHRDLAFLARLTALRSLRLWFGSRASIEELSHPTLIDFEICRVRGLETLGPLDRFPALERLRVEDQLQLESISLGGAALRDISLINCKNLIQLPGLDDLSNLQLFRTG
ncbi:MAG: hypothetical protein ACTHJR_13165 [Sphingomonas sp.]|uniref:hypothetical protein n=1 Tax=Sphingomonas sp. TaxID=28214 RepID=UPI003F819003